MSFFVSGTVNPVSGGRTVSVGGAAADVTAPTITVGPTESNLTENAVTISWTTDEASDSQICRDGVGVSGGAHATCVTDASFVTSHSLSFTGLAASSQYFYVVKSTDAAANTVTSSEGDFTTSAASGDPTPPGLTSSTVLVPPHYSDSQPKQSCTISSIARTTNVVTATLTGCTPNANPQYVVGQSVTVAGVTDTGFNGTFVVSTASATQLTWAQTAGDASSSGGTTVPVMLTDPGQGATIADSAFGTTIRRLWDRANAPTSGGEAHHHYASRSPVNKNNTKVLLRTGSAGYFVVDITTIGSPTLVCSQIGVGGSADASWSRTSNDEFFYVTAGTLKKVDVTACVTGSSSAGHSTVKAFSEYSSIHIGSDEGDLSLSGTYIPLIGVRTADSKTDHFCYNWATDTKKCVWTPDITTDITDHNYCFEDASQFIRYRSANSGKSVSSIARTTNVITVTVSSALASPLPAAGDYVRILRGQNKSSTAATLNGLWQVCGPPTAGCSAPTSTTLTLSSTGGDVATISGTSAGWQLATPWNGFVYLTDSAGTAVLNNIVDANGSHNARGVMTNGKKVVVRESNSQGFSPCGAGSTGWSKIYLAVADWPANGGNDSAQGTCLYNWGSGMGNSHVGAEGKWAVTSHAGTTSTEATLSATWDSASAWKRFTNEEIIWDLDTDTGYRVAHHRTRNTGSYWCTARGAFSISSDGGSELPKYLVFDTSWGGNCAGSLADPHIITLW